MPTFIVIEEGDTKTLTIDQKEVTVGRSSSAEIPVRDIRVSRKHVVFATADGQTVVRDLGSQNGTFVNGSLVETKSLRPGDLIVVGSVRI